MLLDLPFILACSIFNRARGSRLFDKTDSTQVARVTVATAMATLVMFIAPTAESDQAVYLWTLLTLYLWMVFGWGKYAGAAVDGKIPYHETEFKPVDLIMYRVPFLYRLSALDAPEWKHRLWGAVAMSLRMLLIVPCVAGVAFIEDGSYLSLLYAPLMGLVYFPCGYLFPLHGNKAGEYCAGAILGVMLLTAIG